MSSTYSTASPNASSTGSLGDSEKEFLSEISKDNTLMKRKLKFDTLQHKKGTLRLTEKKKVHKETEKDRLKKEKKERKALKHKLSLPMKSLSIKSPISSPKLGHRSPVVSSRSSSVQVVRQDEDVLAMKQKVMEMEKMQQLYKQRINELEQQVSTFSMFHIQNNPAIQEVMEKQKEQKKVLEESSVLEEKHRAFERKFSSNSRREFTPTNALPVPSVNRSLYDGHKRAKEEVISTPSLYLDIPVESIQSKFIDHIRALPKVTKTPSVDVVVKPKLLALYDYKSDIPGRLCFSEGQILFLRKKSSTGWWTAELNGKTGKIPSNYVETLDGSKAFRARVTKDFEAVQTGDMSVKRGELVTVLKKQDNGWWLGERGGKTGFFPSKNAEKIVISNPDA